MSFSEPAEDDPVLVTRDKGLVEDGETFQPTCLNLKDRSVFRGSGRGSHLKIEPTGAPEDVANLLYADWPRNEADMPGSPINDLVVEKMWLDGSRDAFDSIEAEQGWDSGVDWGHAHNGFLSYGFQDRITLRDLYITDFHGYGVHLDGTRHGTVENVHVRRCGSTIDTDGNEGASSRQGMHIATRSSGVPEDAEFDGTNRLIDNPEAGDETISYGNTGSVIVGCTVSGATSSGIDFAGNDNTRFANAIVNCQVWDNEGSGFRVGGWGESLIHNYSARSGSSAYSAGGRHNRLIGNDSAYSRSAGISLRADYSLVAGHHSFRDEGIAIDIKGDGNRLVNNTVTECDTWAVRIDGNNTLIDGLRLIDCDENTAIRNGGEDYVGTTLRNVRAWNTEQIRVYEDYSTIKDVKIYDSEGWRAIRAHGDHSIVEDVYVEDGNDGVVHIRATNVEVRDVRYDGSASNVVVVDDGSENTRISGGDATWSNTADDGIRTAVNGIGRNGGDPSSEGEWNGYVDYAERHQINVHDTENGVLYKPFDGQWEALLTGS